MNHVSAATIITLHTCQFCCDIPGKLHVGESLRALLTVCAELSHVSSVSFFTAASCMSSSSLRLRSSSVNPFGRSPLYFPSLKCEVIYAIQQLSQVKISSNVTCIAVACDGHYFRIQTVTFTARIHRLVQNEAPSKSVQSYSSLQMSVAPKEQTLSLAY